MSNGPLQGIKVIDLTQIYQGPYASFLMARAGAEVIKVEPIGGERLRGHGRTPTPMAFMMLNSNKKCITLNLKTEHGKEILRSLVKKSDVLLENFAPGTMDRLDVGWESLKEINPQLIYGSGTGYGLTGPDRDMLAMDHTIQAASGIMSVTGDEGQPPSRAGGAPADIMSGIHMYAGVLSALVGLQKTGRGTLVEVSMLESMYFILCSELTSYHKNGKFPGRDSARSPAGSCPYGRYECSDGYLALISVSERHWHSICGVIGREDLLNDPNFSGVSRRLEVEEKVNQIIEVFTRVKTREEAYMAFREARVPVAPVRDLEEVRRNPHLHERGMLQHMEHEIMGELILPSSPIRYSDYGSPDLALFPEAGAHNEEIYADWLNLSMDQIDNLKKNGVI